MIYKFFDTSSLLLATHNILFNNDNYKIVISSITLQELENIKNSNNKDEEIKFKAHNLTRFLKENSELYEVIIFTEDMLQPFEKRRLSINNDICILATAYYYDTIIHPDETIFVTNDLCLKNIANLYFGNDSIESYQENTVDNYTGYKEIYLTDKGILCELYENPNNN